MLGWSESTARVHEEMQLESDEHLWDTPYLLVAKLQLKKVSFRLASFLHETNERYLKTITLS